MSEFASDMSWLSQIHARQNEYNRRTASFTPKQLHWKSPLSQMFDATSQRTPFLVYKTSGTRKIKIYGGNISCYSLGNAVVADSSVISIPDATASTKVWVSFTGTWAFNTGADWPTSVLFVKLADISTTGSMAITLLWNGGDLEPEEVFPVTVIQSSGGDTPKYKATTLAGVDVCADQAPSNERTAGFSWIAGTKGIGYFKSDGSFEFYVYDEVRKTLKIDNLVTSVVWDGTTLKQELIQNVRVFVHSDITYGEATIDTPDTCPA